jgi:hypothetical protein
VLGFERRSAAGRGVRGGVGGAVTAIQRFGSALNTNIHFHTLVAQGVFVVGGDGTLGFVPSPAPTDLEVARLLGAVRRRIVRLVKRHGIDLEEPSEEAASTDERLFECPVYAEIQGAAVVGRVATGPRAGALVVRIGRDPVTPAVTASSPLQAHLDGFDLHAAVAVPAGDRARLERLCRYVLRPPLAQERLELSADGKVLLRLRRPWSDGTRAIRFEPTEFLEKLAAMTPRPRVNLLVYHGVFAPHARRRADAVRKSAVGLQSACEAQDHVPAEGLPGAVRAAGDGATDSANGTMAPGSLTIVATPADAASAAASEPQAPGSARPPPCGVYKRPKYYAWADLLQRTFSIDVLACPDCGGRLRFVATIEDRAVIEKILRHLDLPMDSAAAAPARAPGYLPGLEIPPSWVTE